MSDELLIMHCSPTLAGIKTGSMFTCPVASPAELKSEIRRLNRILVPKGLRALPLKTGGGRALIYVYRPALLSADLSDAQARDILRRAGYCCKSADRCVIKLISRLREEKGFPHEIGLFLSYPPEDVRGFVENGGRNCKCVGCWKVYGDERKARLTFERYARCTRSYSRCWEKGKTIDQLTVPV